MEASEQDGWLVIDRKWKPGDTFSITFQPQIEVAPYPNGEYAVRRGTLQYVYPIEHHLHSIKDYPLQGFHDFEITPSDLEQAYQTVFLEDTMPDYGLSFGNAPAGETELNWASAPVWLDAGPHRLVPMGCTILRRASFPLKHSQEKL
jgi:hypothetical protein